MEPKDDDPFANSLLPDNRPPWRSLGTSVTLQMIFIAGTILFSILVTDKIDIESRYFKVTFIKMPQSAAKLTPPRSKAPNLDRFLVTPTSIEANQVSRKEFFRPILSPPIKRAFTAADPAPTPDIGKEITPSLPAPGLIASKTLLPAKPQEATETGSFTDASMATYRRQESGGSTRRAPVAGSAFVNGFSAGSGGRRHGGVQQAAFSEPASPSKKMRSDTQEKDTLSRKSIKIKFKPQPAYTSEARSKQIEGDVILAVVFSATGMVIVKSLVRGLGYGLDESAREAAGRIQFDPAKDSDGNAVDTEATIHITFQLAS